MLVYGRQEYERRLNTVVGQLRSKAGSVRRGSVDEWRALLIQAGQVEQGVEDLHEVNALPPRLVHAARGITELTATAFHSTWARTQKVGDQSNPNLGGFSDRLCEELSAMPCASNPLLRIRIPEGFEYYALFPEQYCVSALKWAQERGGTWPKQVAVVGIRSIGTTLSAVVAAALTQAGWQVHRLTVRPKGHPFQRIVRLPPQQWQPVPCAIIVDEGPGLSGSSMAAAAHAVCEAGPKDIVFFPGHGGEPGSQASAAVRQWWTRTPRYVTGLEELNWNGRFLTESLQERAQSLVSTAAPHPGHRQESAASEDLSGGNWRKRAFQSEADWPAVCARLERLKLLCPTRSGQDILWKFSGLGGVWKDGSTTLELVLNQSAATAAETLSPEPLGDFRGFMAIPWVEGTRLNRADGSSPAVLRHLGRYLLRASGPGSSAGEAAASFARLWEMLSANTSEALGDAWAERAWARAERVRGREARRSYGDGRLAPHEWIRTEAGGLLKSDGAGHQWDHTLVGQQPVLWDVAGALVEWDLEMVAASPLLSALQEIGGPIQADELTFYQMAYAGFRMGLTSLCAGQLPEGSDQARLRRASQFYRGKLKRLLGEPLPPSG